MAIFVMDLKSFEWDKRKSTHLFCKNPALFKYADDTICKQIMIRSHVTGQEYSFKFIQETTNGAFYYHKEESSCPVSIVYVGSTEQIDRIKEVLKLI